jgi:hypothetical protein
MCVDVSVRGWSPVLPDGLARARARAMAQRGKRGKSWERSTKKMSSRPSRVTHMLEEKRAEKATPGLRLAPQPACRIRRALAERVHACRASLLLTEDARARPRRQRRQGAARERAQERKRHRCAPAARLGSGGPNAHEVRRSDEVERVFEGTGGDMPPLPPFIPHTHTREHGRTHVTCRSKRASLRSRTPGSLRAPCLLATAAGFLPLLPAALRGGRCTSPSLRL